MGARRKFGLGKGGATAIVLADRPRSSAGRQALQL